MQLIQVVPRLGPWDGVGDYASRLGEALLRRHGVISRFIEAGSADGRKALVAELDKAHTETWLLLHYVGYGYARRGAPLWLAGAMNRRRNLRLGVVFHELYATGKPWQSAFWLSGLQKRVVTRLARECDGALLTREANRQWLDATGALAGKGVAVLPVSSNVGEPSQVRPLSDRSAKMVVWGSAQARAAVYGMHWPSVLRACRQLGMSGLVDVGPPAKLPSGGSLPIEALGRLDVTALSQVLLDARFGLLVYPASFLAKSSILGAYAAHGLVPVVLDELGTQDMDGLSAGQTYLRLANGGIEKGMQGSPDDIARRARDWYAGHDTAAHAVAVLRLLEGERA